MHGCLYAKPFRLDADNYDGIIAHFVGVVLFFFEGEAAGVEWN